MKREKENKSHSVMEGLMVELVAMVLSYVEPLSLPVCRSVCSQWNQALAIALAPLPPPPPGDDYVRLLAREGRLSVLEWAHANGCPGWRHKRTLVQAAMGGHIDVLRWAHANGCPGWDVWTCAGAAWGGHLAALQWLRANGCPWDGWTIAQAIDQGRHDVLEWAIANGCPEHVAMSDDFITFPLPAEPHPSASEEDGDVWAQPW
jgi:hypothetical protein